LFYTFLGALWVQIWQERGGSRKGIMGIHVKVNRNKLYLDIYLNGERHSESLHMAFTGDAKQDRETRRLAEQCRAIREAQLLTHAYGLVDTIGGKQSLYEYLKNMGPEKPHQQGLKISWILSWWRIYTDRASR
jgi:hypothetical protein